MVAKDCWNSGDLPPSPHRRHLDVGPAFDDDATVGPRVRCFGDLLVQNRDDWVDVVAVAGVALPRIN